jgi:GNAT superfamily N-acetyltransferase
VVARTRGCALPPKAEEDKACRRKTPSAESATVAKAASPLMAFLRSHQYSDRRWPRLLQRRRRMQIEARHDLSADDIGAIEDHLYAYNRHAIGAHDGRDLGFVLRDDAGHVVGAAFGYSWAGIAELRQMWVDERHRGRGYGRALLNAFIDEAARRGVRRIWLSSYDFQAPAMYENAGFVRMAELKDFPLHHTNTILCKIL